MEEERALTSWLDEAFRETRTEPPFNFNTMFADMLAAMTPEEAAQHPVAYAYDRARSLCDEAIRNGGLHISYLAEAENQFRVLRAYLLDHLGPRREES
jgi:cytosine/adenosine deaminase-related metal-dependent hydrolase